ncbi:alpha/beta fold hydrolase [Kitasatospora viridis]|uniref:Alpha/beta hydrolase family protein n=1 Tax=Kitasatospora viridis TaxID=281105 RepID=A0A561UPI5_9ACTN|nr:alpha/beta fold hydrolase [Kitasatospora viridis]TWG01275.1 alpha/beta hydrolase family protein [Kitasatospora viridis]
MASYLLVPGTYHGGWWFEPVAERLRDLGHRVVSLTLTGVGEHNHLLDGSVNLDTHIADVVRAIDEDPAEPVVLVGHSYGGMPITGAADQRPERIRSLVHLDAFAPRDGESAFDINPTAWRERIVQAAAGNGFAMVPPAFLADRDPRITTHPLASQLQRIRLTGAHEKIERRTYLHLSGFEGTPFRATWDRIRQDPSWTALELPVGHDIIRDAPDQLLELLLAQAE